MSIQLFLDSIRSARTKESYNRSLKFYGYDNLILDPLVAQTNIINFIIKCKKEGKSYAAIHNYVSALKAYYQINDVMLNVRKIGKFMPEHRLIKRDRSYTHQEISKMLQVADLRMKVVILLLASSGCRLGAIPFLKLRHLQDRTLTIYENDKEEYTTFVTQECKSAIDSYLDMRSRYGEKLNDNSPLIREEFNIRIKMAKAKHIKREAISFQLDVICKKGGVRFKEIPLVHGFRKFFTTQLINSKVNPEIREMLLGHKIGLASSYYKPTHEEMLLEYEKAINNLTINEENRLKTKVDYLQQKYDRIELILDRIDLVEKQLGINQKVS